MKTSYRKILAFSAMMLVAGQIYAPIHGYAMFEKDVPVNKEQVDLSFAPLVKKTAPAVVNIYTKKRVKENVSPFMNDPFFRQFFGDDPSGDMQGGQMRERVENSLGSGVILDAQGLIITNAHVINGADEITVVLNDRREFEASVVLADKKIDLAVLRVNPKGQALPFLELHDSDKLEVGDLVLAIGNPFGVGQTVTSGIISALARTAAGISDFGFFIQTDAAINPGNSGGALVGMDGKLIGINSAIFSKDGGSLGIGFAIPANMVRTVMVAAESGQKFTRPWLGAHGETVTADLANSLGLPKPGGVLINQVSKQGPAEAAGLKAGDVVLAVGGKPVQDMESLRYRFVTLPLNNEAEFDVLRKGQPLKLKIVVKAPERPTGQKILKLAGNHILAGAGVADLFPAMAEEMGIPDSDSGVVVVDIARGSPAARVGIQPRDIIDTVNGLKIGNIDDLNKALATGTRRWQLLIKRGTNSININIAF
ncbi:MAG: DegQ family serine endoprotease [Alphaproteobacteria bacterium]